MLFAQKSLFSKSLLGLGLSISLYCSIASTPVLSTIAYDKAFNIPLEGKASWIGERFQGKKTASGELFDMNDLTASHATLPFGTMVKVTSTKTKKSVVVRINNRSEIDSGRIIDLSKRAAEQIGLIEEGVGIVNLAVISSAANKSTNNNVSITPAPTKSVPTTNKPSSTETSVATKFQIQYGSFFDLDNAVEFRDALKKKGIETELETAKGNDRTVYRVNSSQKFNSRTDAKTALTALAPQEGAIVPVKAESNATSTTSSKPSATTKASNVSASTPKTGSPSPTVNKDGKTYEYGIQFGAFEAMNNAKELQNKLLVDKGIRTIVHQFPDDEKKLYRVLTNRPFGSREESDKFLKDNNVPGVILTFMK